MRLLDIHPNNQVILSIKYLQLKDKPVKLQNIFVRPDRVSQKIVMNAKKLDLTGLMSMYSVFNVSLLQKYYLDQLLQNTVQVKDNIE